MPRGCAHPLGSHDETLHEPCEPVEHVVDRQEGVRQHDSFGRGVRDVSLVPEGDVLEPDERISSDDPSQAADALRDDRVPLVRHGRRPLLALRERLLHLANLRACEVADLEREPVERRPDDRERRKKLRVAIALKDLRGRRSRLEPEGLARATLHLRGRGRVRPHRPRELPDSHSRERVVEPVSIALELEHPAEQLEPERRRLRVNAVRTAYRHRVPVLLCARENACGGAVDAVANQRACALDGQRERGVDDVGRGEPVVEPASVGSEIRRDRVDERRDVVVRRSLELGDARRRRDAGAFADGARARCRNGS